ncbi:MAG: hypothetical protein ACOCP1_00040 [Campylobacterales bacterium]
MQECLVRLLREYEELENILLTKNRAVYPKVNMLFERLVDCFYNLGSDKLLFPNEFQRDVALYKGGNSSVIRKFRDVEIRYMFIADLYDYCRLKKIIIKE